MWTAIVGMFAAVIGFLGVIVGAAVTGFVTLRQAELATKREREARQLEREQKRKDVVDAFQRETLLALQDATMDLRIAATRFLDRKVATWKSTGEWPATGYGESMPDDWIEADLRVLKLAVRVFDDDLQRLAIEYRSHALATAEAPEEAKAYESAVACGELLPRIHTRVGALLPRVF
jgi:hypothetical protein